MEVGSRWRRLFSLRVKLIAVLIPLMAVCLLTAMVGLEKYLMEFFQRRTELEATRLSRAVEMALRQTMLRSPELILDTVLADVHQTPDILRIWVVDRNGRVAHADDPADIGQVLDRTKNSICRICHADGKPFKVRTVFTHNEAGTPIVRHVRPLSNERACWGCHDPKIRHNGMLLLDQSTQPYLEALWVIQSRLSAAGGVTLTFLAFMTLAVTTVLVQRPVARLIAGVRRLGTGDLKTRVPVRGRDELAELATNFNGMAENLDHSIQEICNKKAELSVIYSILERLTKTIDLKELKEIVLQAILDVLKADRVLLLSHLTAQESAEILLKIRGDSRLYRFPYPEDGGVLPEWLASDIATSWSRGELHEPYVAQDAQMALIPVEAGESRALLVVGRQQPFTDVEANQNLLGAVAHHIGVAMENARLYSLAITDDLTGVFNARHFHNRIADAVSRYQQSGRKFATIMLDLDHFKKINDTFGHQTGDAVLRQVGRVLISGMRIGDTAYRYGGEEFAVLLPDADAAMAWAVAERIRKEVEDLKIEFDAHKNIAITVSAGLAVCPGDGTSIEQLTAAADTALYVSKTNGRNRVSWFSGETPATCARSANQAGA